MKDGDYILSRLQNPVAYAFPSSVLHSWYRSRAKGNSLRDELNYWQQMIACAQTRLIHCSARVLAWAAGRKASSPAVHFPESVLNPLVLRGSLVLPHTNPSCQYQTRKLTHLKRQEVLRLFATLSNTTGSSASVSNVTPR